MVATLILLYALDTGQIPQGCYIAAWTITIIELILRLLKAYIEVKKDEIGL